MRGRCFAEYYIAAHMTKDQTWLVPRIRSPVSRKGSHEADLRPWTVRGFVLMLRPFEYSYEYDKYEYHVPLLPFTCTVLYCIW